MGEEKRRGVRYWFMRIGIVAATLALIVGAYSMGCASAERNLTSATAISEAIDKLASPSAVLSDCWAHNSVPGAGGNTKNCDPNQSLYNEEWRLLREWNALCEGVLSFYKSDQQNRYRGTDKCFDVIDLYMLEMKTGRKKLKELEKP